MQSLRKGNLQSVTIEKDGGNQKVFIEADPQFKKVTLYDSAMKKVAKEELGNYQSMQQQGSKGAKQEMGSDKKKDLKAEIKLGKEKLVTKTKSLLPKKRLGTKKSLGIA